MKLAVDSLPLSEDVYQSMDYSGLQVHGLEHTALHRGAKVSGSGTTWRAELSELYWQDGQRVAPAEYAEGLGRVIRAQPLLRSYLKPRLKRLSTGQNHLQFEFRRPVGPRLFDWPNWVPYRPGAKSGAYSLQREESGWSFEGGRLSLVRSPEENQDLFENGQTDFTADTAIRLGNVDQLVRRKDTGLFGSLVYSKGMNEKLAAKLSAALSGIRFSPEIEHVFPSIRTEVSGNLAPDKIVIAYDDFYPNLEITTCLARHLRAAGWDVRLVRDDYYRPRQRADAKFMILRRPVMDDCISSAWMNLFPRAHDSRMRVQAYVERCEIGEAFRWKWITELGLGVPLFKIPALYRSRQNKDHPLLKVFA